jgi:hypothetical protein
MTRFAIILALLLFESGAAWATSPPKFDLQVTCHRGQPPGGGGEKTHYQGCLDDETDAQKEMLKTWSTFKPGAQAMCAQETRIGGTPSYVELLTCLQLDQQGVAAALENKKALTLQRFHPPLPGAAAPPK